MSEYQLDLFGDNKLPKLTWTEQYRQVLASARWKRLRAKLVDGCDRKCQHCGKQESKLTHGSIKLELHHKTYERLGCERDEDLEVLCSPCHIKADRKRAALAQLRNDRALQDARFSGWAEKVYGEDWHLMDDDGMHDRFVDWVERKEYYG